MKHRHSFDLPKIGLYSENFRQNIVKDIKLQNIDMGIAMCHFELTARELGFIGDWNVNDPQIKSDGMEYIVSRT